MLKRILVPLDGTTFAERALPYAIQLANENEAELVLKRVVYINSLIYAEASSGMVLEQAKREALEESYTYLAHVRDIISDPNNTLTLPFEEIETIVSYSQPSEVIPNLIGTENIDLIVMTTHAHSNIGEFFIGSTAREVVQFSPVPVMLIRPDHHQIHGQPAPTLRDLLNPAEKLHQNDMARRERVLVTLDRTLFAEKALSAATDLATAYQADLYMIEVVEPTIPVGYGFDYTGAVGEMDWNSMEEEREAAYEYLNSAQERLSKQGLSCIKIVREGNAADEIALYANSIQPICIVMSTHARGPIGRTFIGSTAFEVLRKTDLPVVMVHPQPEEIAMTATSTDEGAAISSKLIGTDTVVKIANAATNSLN